MKYPEDYVNKIIQGDCLEILKTIPDESIDCVITSPPYWGLRNYGVKGQFGLEKTPEEYVAKLVEVFREVKRVLKKEGVMFLNLGDTYTGNKTGNTETIKNPNCSILDKEIKRKNYYQAKQEIGIPFLVRQALMEDSWICRQTIIWAKPNPMPESVTDRCTKSHEYIFLLSKSQKYYFNSGAIKEKCVQGDNRVRDRDISKLNNTPGKTKSGGLKINNYEFRNKRSVWTVATKPFKDAHFATFPEELIKPMVLAGCPEGGIILDPFFGAGTTGVVCKKENKNYIGIELNPDYCKIAEERIKNIPERLF